MSTRAYALTPHDVAAVETAYRRIATPIPVPESISLLEQLRRYEPRCMEGQPPVVWDRAEGFQVFDRWGNMWLDFSSGVVATNAGHGRTEIIEAIVEVAQHGLLTHYCFPGRPRAELARRLVELAPDPLDKAFILSTGSETTECAIKLSRARAHAMGKPDKVTMVSFVHAFHGRTLGAQLIGGIPALKAWIGPLDPHFVQVPFPDGFRCEDTSFAHFEKTLDEAGIKGAQVAGVICETYQGGGADFAPPEYMQQLRAWCDTHDVLLVFDEVQAGFGRTGTLWGFEHYGVVPDLMCLGKGISSSLPTAAVVGRADILNLFPPGSMTSTHTGNPVCAAAACASIDLIIRENLVQNAATVGAVMNRELQGIQERHADVIGAAHGKGLVAALQCIKPGSKDPDPDLAWNTVGRCIDAGLLLFAPVGFGGGSIKIAPPLCITEPAIREGVAVIESALDAALAAR